MPFRSPTATSTRSREVLVAIAPYVSGMLRNRIEEPLACRAAFGRCLNPHAPDSAATCSL